VGMIICDGVVKMHKLSLGLLLFGSALSPGLLSKISAVVSWVGLLVSIGATVNAFQQLE